VFGSIGLLCVGFAVVRARRALARRLWIEVRDRSFLVQDSHGEREIRDDQVICMSVIDTKKYSSGLLKALDRRFIVWIASQDGSPDAIEMQSRIKANESDPLQPLLDRLAESLLLAAEQDMQAGRPVLGEYWRIERETLIVQPPRTPAVEIHLSDVTACDYVDRHVCVWRRGQDEVAARIPLTTTNAHVLGMLLGKRLASKATDASEAPPAEGLGRVIFERKPQPGTVAALFIFFLLADLAGVLCLVGGIMAGEYAVIAVGLGLLFVLSPLLLLGWLHVKRATFRCHEWGVYQRGLQGEKQLRYADVGSFTYGATRHFYNGAYTGTSVNMVFQPDDKGTKPLSYNAHLKHLDDELENLREHVSRVVAGRLAQRFAAGEPVSWTKNLRLLPDGIEHRAGGFFSSKQPVLYRFEDITGFDIQEGYFHLWVAGKKKSVVQEPCSAPNFYPGFQLLLTLVRPSADQPGEAAAASED